MNWKKLFKPHILERGMEYYYAGCVGELSEEEGQITAVVEGTEDYDVLIEVDEGRVEVMECTCPYAEGGENCKHMAAVLYAWKQGGKPKKASSPKVQESYAQLKVSVDGADEALVRRFLTDVLWQDDKLRLRFLTEACPERRPELVGAVKALVEDAVERHMDGDGSIDYYHAGDFISELNDILDEEAVARVERGEYRDAFRVTTYVFLGLDGVEMDDSDGGITEIAERCSEIWMDLLQYADESLKKEMFDWLMKRFDGDVDDYLSMVSEEALVDSFDEPAYLKQVLAREQAILDRENDGKWSYPAENRALHCVRLMERLEYPAEEIEAYAKRYWNMQKMRDYYIERCRREGRREDLIATLKQCIALEKRSWYGAAAYHIQLKDAYAELGMKDAYKQELWEIVTNVTPAKLECYREYRALFATEAWPEERERLFAALPKHAGIEALYAEERLYDRLLERALAANGLYMLRSYESELLPRYPEQVLEKYAREMRRVARESANRSVYQDWVELLRHMREMPGGGEVVKAIVGEWRAAYKRRSAMMEELNRL